MKRRKSAFHFYNSASEAIKNKIEEQTEIDIQSKLRMMKEEIE